MNFDDAFDERTKYEEWVANLPPDQRRAHQLLPIDERVQAERDEMAIQLGHNDPESIHAISRQLMRKYPQIMNNDELRKEAAEAVKKNSQPAASTDGISMKRSWKRWSKRMMTRCQTTKNSTRNSRTLRNCAGHRLT